MNLTEMSSIKGRCHGAKDQFRVGGDADLLLSFIEQLSIPDTRIVEKAGGPSDQIRVIFLEVIIFVAQCEFQASANERYLAISSRFTSAADKLPAATLFMVSRVCRET